MCRPNCGDAVALLAGQRTWVRVLAGHHVYGLGQTTYTCVPLVTKQYNLVPTTGGDLFGWESITA